MSGESLINLTDDQKIARIAESEQIIVEADKAIELGKKLVKLKNSEEYKALIDDEYYVNYAQDIFKEMTNPKQFAAIPLENCEDTLAGIKAFKAFIGFERNLGVVELNAQTATRRKDDASDVLDAIG